VHIVVCTKQTPDSAAKLTVDAAGVVSWGDSPIVINPWDEYAVEEALLIKERLGDVKVTVVSVGPEAALEALKHAIAMGCDEAVRVWDDSFQNIDSLGTARVLAAAIKKMGDVDLVLMGKSAIDSQTGQVAVALARQLGFAPLTYVIKINELDPAGKIAAERLLEEGRQVVEAPLPAVVGTTKGINEPRYPSFMGIRKATRAAYPLWSAADVGVQAGTPGVRWGNITPPPAREGSAEIISADTPEEAARLLVDRLLAEKVI
jgi:electron transfer flavoprotein beta subunit